ncbi:MAG: endonuclease/exonuclease/phosphatase family protein [Gammaproteobacteria bacterium]|nr:endonuclease/exonuclease/phosphatase family protein [Gammaproteobacteria bacterium]
MILENDTVDDHSNERLPSVPVANCGGTDARPLRILSFNVQTGIGTSQYSHYVTGSWKHFLPAIERKHNLKHIAAELSRYDVVGLQEVDGGSLRSKYMSQTEYLARKANFPFWHEQINRNLGRIAQHSIGFLSRINFKVSSENKLPGIIPGRGALAVEMEYNGHTVCLITAHLALGRRTRLKQMAYLSELISDYEHVVLMGDFNCDAHSREMDALLSLTDLHPPVADMHTFPSWRPLRSLDHILVSRSMRVDKLNVVHLPVSDHLPVAMEVSLPAMA